jgi:hypothetical protein
LIAFADNWATSRRNWQESRSALPPGIYLRVHELNFAARLVVFGSRASLFLPIRSSCIASAIGYHPDQDQD